MPRALQAPLPFSDASSAAGRPSLGGHFGRRQRRRHDSEMHNRKSEMPEIAFDHGVHGGRGSQLGGAQRHGMVREPTRPMCSQEPPSAGPTPRPPRRLLGIEAGDGRLLRDRPLSRCVSTAHVAQPPPSTLLRPSDPSQPAARAAARVPPCGIATGAPPDDPPCMPPAPSPVPARLERLSVALTRVPPRRQARERFGRGRGGGAWACEAEEAPEPGAGAGRTAQRAPGASAPSWRA